jgi:hypothetical protein
MVARELLSVRDAPLAATASEAVALYRSGKSAWVRLTDASADCRRHAIFETRLDDGNVRKSSAFVAVNATRDIDIAVIAHDVGACEHLGLVHFIGMLKPLGNDERFQFAGHGLPFSEKSGPRWWLCAWCVPRDDRGAMITLGILTSVLVLAMGYATRAFWRARNPASPPTATNKTQADRDNGRSRKAPK